MPLAPTGASLVVSGLTRETSGCSAHLVIRQSNGRNRYRGPSGSTRRFTLRREDAYQGIPLTGHGSGRHGNRWALPSSGEPATALLGPVVPPPRRTRRAFISCSPTTSELRGVHAKRGLEPYLRPGSDLGQRLRFAGVLAWAVRPTGSELITLCAAERTATLPDAAARANCTACRAGAATRQPFRLRQSGAHYRRA